MSGKRVSIKWKKVSNVTGYQVYRSDSKNGKYKRIKTFTKNYTSSNDKKLKKGKTYYYKVRSYKKVGKKIYYSAYSAVKSIKIQK